MSEKTVWRSASMEGKWKDGKGDVRLALVEFYGKVWLDWRVFNVTGEKEQVTRQGCRLTLEQAEEMLPRLIEAIEQGKQMKEQQERKENQS
tara:strand:- start:925 stop:1197 length:273 start_codon:yes stop_codon:yes gene_type:complete